MFRKRIFRSWVHELADGREYLLTKQAAHALGKAEQTLRDWNHCDKGPIKPKKIGRRLHWSVSDIEAFLCVQVDLGYAASSESRQ